MKPFDPTKPVQTRDGREARIICTDYSGSVPGYSIIALVTFARKQEIITLTPTGRFFLYQDKHSPNDLVNIPEKKSGWSLIYKDIQGRRITGSHIYSTEQEAECAFASAACAISIGCVTWEE
jgi:hypothetical protein